jgi:hypothetical protein
MAPPDFIEVQKYLSGIEYPATKDQLIEHAKGHRAPQEVIEALSSLPDEEYDGPNKVSSAVAKT